VMKMRSPVFEAMLANQMRESSQIKHGLPIPIPELKETTFKRFRCFVYKNKLDDDGEVDLIQLLDLIEAATRFDIQELQDYCVLKMKKDINVSNIFGFLEALETYQSKTFPWAQEIYIFCLMFIKQNFAKLDLMSGSQSLLKFPKKMFHILCLLRLNV